MALRAYRSYARYLVEIMRLPSMPPRAGGGDARSGGARRGRADLARARRGVIFTACHVGNNEAIAAGIGVARLAAVRPGRRLDLPRAVRAPQASERARWGTRSSPGATCARSTASSGDARCSRSSSTGATAPTTSRSACSVPGRRCRRDRPPWPARPARSSCRSSPGGCPTAGSMPRSTTRSGSRRPTGRHPAGDPGGRRRARAGHRRRTGPVVQLQADVARDRGRGRGARGPGRRMAGPGEPEGAGGRSPCPEATVAGRRRAEHAPSRRGPRRAGGLVARLPASRAGSLLELTDLAGELWYRARPSAGRPGPAEPAVGSPPGWTAEDRPTRRTGPPRRTRRPSSDSSGRPSGTTPATTSTWRGRRRSRPAFLDERLAVETPDTFEAAFGAPGPRIFIGLHYGAIELQAYVAAVHRTGRR